MRQPYLRAGKTRYETMSMAMLVNGIGKGNTWTTSESEASERGS
jgi:hypothetical protein